MLRLPRLRYLRPQTAAEAAALVAASGGGASLVAGGTDLIPNLKRRQFDFDTLVQVPPAPGIRVTADGEVVAGATATLAEVAAHPGVRAALPGLAEAAEQVSTPPLRNAATIGGNLCVDTRCNYYNQTYEWRRAIGFCMKRDGDLCLVAPGSDRCWAVSSSDTAPMLIALGATVELEGSSGAREIPVAALYRDDGIEHLGKAPDEVVTAIRVPPAGGVATAYAKLRRRGSIDFPIAGAAVALSLEGGSITSVRVVLSAVASHPLDRSAALRGFVGRRLDAGAAAEMGEVAAATARPLDNTDLNHAWRRKMAARVATDAVTMAAERASWQIPSRP